VLYSLHFSKFEGFEHFDLSCSLMLNPSLAHQKVP
jgi:hypothetical protein